MFPVKRTILQAVLVCSFLTSSLAQGEREKREDYDPTENRRPTNVTVTPFYNFVGSYYNATVEVDYIIDFAFDIETSEQCKALRNISTTFKYNAILGVQEHRKWNPGNSSLQFWITLMPQTSPPTTIASAMDEVLWRSGRNSSHIYSTEQYAGAADKDMGPDYFHPTPTQVPGGAYNVTESWKAEAGGIRWQNIEMPVCNTTEYKNEWRMRFLDKSLSKDAWTGPFEYQYPRTSLQFDGNTANLTFNAFFVASPEIQPNLEEILPNREGPTWNKGRDLVGRISFNFSGILDEYHSDVLSLDDPLPVWQRTVGFGNNSANIGYGDSGAERTVGRAGLALMAIIIAIVVVL